MHRPSIGIFALVMLAASAAMYLATSAESWHSLAAALFRVGLVLGAWWLAEPQLRRLPGWLLAAVGLSMVVLAIRPRYFLVALVILVVAAIVRPKGTKGRPKRRPPTSSATRDEGRSRPAADDAPPGA
jgi:hypothetical protein